MSRVLYLDCFSGASGDMVIGALLDAGLPFEQVEAALGSLALGGDSSVAVKRVDRSGIGATKFTVTDSTAEGSHRHRHLSGITKLVDRSSLTAASKTRANRIFRRLAETEAAIHQMPVEKVHLHEVGALDSIIDIVGGVFAFEWFGADRIVSSPINVGSGTVSCEHGVLPVPAPATASLVAGVPIYATGPAGERLTPTGALLVTEFAEEYGPLPTMRIERIGYGAGDRNPDGHPNVLRVLVGEDVSSTDNGSMTVVECEIDDMNPQIFGVLMSRLQAVGAVDVSYTAVQMKKNRPGTRVTVLTSHDGRQAVCDTLFRETSTIGVRYTQVARETLAREFVSVSTAYGDIPCKVSRRGATVVNVAPEFDACARVADERAISVKEVLAAAHAAARAIGEKGDAEPGMTAG